MKIIHTVEIHHERNAMNEQRKEKARATWQVLYQNGVTPCHYSSYARDSRLIGDHRGLPFLKDTVAAGLALCQQDSDIVFISNDDVIFHPQFTDALKMFISIFDVCTVQRREFKQAYPANPMTAEQITLSSESHMGREVVAATRVWWIEHWSTIPDFLLGAESWDLCLAAKVRKDKGFLTTHANLFDRVPCCELPWGYVSHEAHTGSWVSVGEQNPANRYNRGLFSDWVKAYAPEIPVPI